MRQKRKREVHPVAKCRHRSVDRSSARGSPVRVGSSDWRCGGEGLSAHRRAASVSRSFSKGHALWYFRSLWSNPKAYYGPRELQAHRVDWVEGSFLMTTAENWVALGGFDEKNFYYGNDVEFRRSTSERGLKVVQCSGVLSIMPAYVGGFVVSEMSHLYAGFRCYHRKFSGLLNAWWGYGPACRARGAHLGLRLVVWRYKKCTHSKGTSSELCECSQKLGTHHPLRIGWFSRLSDERAYLSNPRLRLEG